MQDLEAGDKCYIVSKQTASKKEDPISGKLRTVFLRTAVGFRFCEDCWAAVSGDEYIIELG